MKLVLDKFLWLGFGIMAYGLLKVKRTRAFVEVRSDKENPLFVKLKRLDNVERVVLSGIVEEIDQRFGSPQAIILFGSFVRGEDLVRSDIDTATINNNVSM